MADEEYSIPINIDEENSFFTVASQLLTQIGAALFSLASTRSENSSGKYLITLKMRELEAREKHFFGMRCDLIKESLESCRKILVEK